MPSDDALDALVIGAGQAGLATAYHLRRHGARFVVVDAAPEIGHAWRSRWTSLRLFSPAQYDNLPGMAFPAPADTYPTKDQAADYLVAYAQRFELPVLLGCRVHRLERADDGFAVHTSQGLLRARRVIVATGPFQQPAVPALAGRLPEPVRQLHSAEYRSPADIPGGNVVVVGAGNSGRQIAVELAATHQVTLAVGTEALELPQRILGHDLFWWLIHLGAITKTQDSFIARRMRARGDLVIGSPMTQVRRAGVRVAGRATDVDGAALTFSDGAKVEPSTIIWATGFRTDYSWIDVPQAVREGRIIHKRGVTPTPGLGFVGLPWQHTRGSALLGFVQDDAEWVVVRLTTERPLAGAPLA